MASVTPRPSRAKLAVLYFLPMALALAGGVVIGAALVLLWVSRG